MVLIPKSPNTLKSNKNCDFRFLTAPPTVPAPPHCVAPYLWRLSSHRETENCSVTAQTPASSSTAKTWQNQYFFWPFLIKHLSPEIKCSYLDSWRRTVHPGLTARPILFNEPANCWLAPGASFKPKIVLLTRLLPSKKPSNKKKVGISDFFSIRKTGSTR